MLILQSFWTYNTDIWASLVSLSGILLSVAGLIYSKKAFKEAELAKNAAYSAGIVVKTQENLMELERISNECSFSEDITYSQATNKLNSIASRIYVILGMYSKDEEFKEQIEAIKNNFDTVKLALESANPSVPDNSLNDKTVDKEFKVNYPYNITSLHFTKLINNLSTLRGTLNSKLIKNQTNGN
jgi:hypothetical protein